MTIIANMNGTPPAAERYFQNRYALYPPSFAFSSTNNLWSLPSVLLLVGLRFPSLDEGEEEPSSIVALLITGVLGALLGSSIPSKSIFHHLLRIFF